MSKQGLNKIKTNATPSVTTAPQARKGGGKAKKEKKSKHLPEPKPTIRATEKSTDKNQRAKRGAADVFDELLSIDEAKKGDLQPEFHELLRVKRADEQNEVGDHCHHHYLYHNQYFKLS